MLDFLLVVVRGMDAGYLEWMRAEHDRHVRTNKPAAAPPPKLGGKKGGRRARRR